MYDKFQKTFSNVAEHCPVSVLCTEDNNVSLINKMIDLFNKDFIGTSIYDLSNARLRHREEHIASRPTVGGRTTLMGHWQVLCSMEHDSSLYDQLDDLQDTPVKVCLCMLAASRYTRKGYSTCIIPILVFTAPSRHWLREIVQIKNKGKLSVEILVDLIDKQATFDLHVSGKLSAFMPGDLRSQQQNNMDLFLTCISGLPNTISPRGVPNSSMRGIFDEGCNLFDSALLIRQFYFAKHYETGDTDNITFMVLRLKHFLRQYVPVPLDLQRVCIEQSGEEYFSFCMGLHRLNNSTFYKDFKTFHLTLKWHINIRNMVDEYKQKELHTASERLAWLNFKVPDVMQTMLRAVVINPIIEQTVIYRDGRCGRDCVHCQSSVLNVFEKIRKLLTEHATKYDFLSYFKNTVGLSASSNPQRVAYSKLAMYDPRATNWYNFSRYATFKLKNEPNKERSKALTRSEILTVLTKKNILAAQYDAWLQNHRGINDVPKPSEDETMMSLICGDKARRIDSSDVLPVVTKQVGEGIFKTFLSTKEYWLSTKDHHLKATSFEKKIRKILLKHGHQNKALSEADFVHELTGGNVSRMHYFNSYINQILNKCKLQDPKINEVNLHEMGSSCVHINFDPHLSVFGVLLDLDMKGVITESRLRRYEFYQILEDITTAFSRLIFLSRAISDNMRTISQHDMDAYLEGENGCLFGEEDSCSVRTFAYMSIVKPADFYAEKHDHIKATDLSDFGKDLTVPPDVSLSDDQLKQIDCLNERLNTQSARLMIEFPPNVMFKNTYALLSYKQTLFMFIKSSPSCQILCRVSKTRSIDSVIDMDVLSRQCRMPWSSKYTGNEVLEYTPFLHNFNLACDESAVIQTLVRGMFDKTVGLTHADRWAGHYSLRQLGAGVVIGPCCEEYNDSFHEFGPSMKRRKHIRTNTTFTSLLRSVESEKNVSELESVLVTRCKQKDPTILSLDDALQFVVKPAMLDAISSDFADASKSDERIYSSVVIKQRFLSNCYLQKEPVLCSNIIIGVRPNKFSRYFSDCVFKKHSKSKKKCSIYLSVNDNLAVELLFYCFGTHGGISNASTPHKVLSFFL